MFLWQAAGAVVQFAVARLVEWEFGRLGLTFLAIGAVCVRSRAHLRKVPAYWWAILALILLTVQA